MRVRISYTVEVSDHMRRIIRHYYGEPGLATRAEVRQWYMRYGDSNWDDASYELQRDEEERAPTH